MRNVSLVAAVAAVALAGCGKDNPAAIDAPPGTVIDGPPGTEIDADTTVVLPDAAVATCVPVNGTNVSTEVVLPAGMLTRPNLVTAPVGDRRLFVVEQPGRISIIDQGTLQATPFLDIRSDAGGPVDDTGSEQGLLGLAFHPDFATNHKFYVYYTRADDDNVVAEYQTGSNGLGDTTSARVLLTVDDRFSNHNGGMVEFSPVDGFLYIALGDGGDGNDPDNNAQRTSQLLGKILRIDVDTTTGTKPYGIPATNPFANSPDGVNDPRPEVWAYGLRNPFRFSFDSNGDLFIGDVGQNAREEVNVQRVGVGGVNYGWDDIEGDICAEAGCDLSAGNGKVPPVTTHPNGPWGSVMGGAVYRGSCFPDLVGDYFYSDHFVTELWSFDAATATGDTMRTAEIPGSITSIHPDALGELYITMLSGAIHRIVAN